jgi:hypothetical protein
MSFALFVEVEDTLTEKCLVAEFTVKLSLGYVLLIFSHIVF